MGNVRQWDPKSPNTATTPPTVSSVSPSTATVGEQTFFSVTGANFTPTSVISVDGSAVPTTYVTPSQVRGNVTFSSPGAKQVTVDGAGPVTITVT